MNNTQIIAELFSEAALEAGLNAEQQELIARRLNEASYELASDDNSEYLDHSEYEFLSTANAR